jgi:GTP 3',8-cyclase
MYDRFERHIDYLRISVTDRCNLRCIYCMPAEGIQLMGHDDILSYNEIAEVARIAVGMGVSKIRITGGEPLVRRGIVSLVKLISEIPGLADLAMTTNGMLLGELAMPLKDAGLQRINVSLDTLDPEKFSRITRGGRVEDVLEGLRIAKAAGFSPIKLNCVTGELTDDDDIIRLKQYAEENGFQVRFIRQMDLNSGEFYLVEGGDGGNCSKCNRLRLTSNGLIKPCLFNAIGYSVRELGAREAITRALDNKPRCGTFNQQDEFYQLGG